MTRTLRNATRRYVRCWSRHAARSDEEREKVSIDRMTESINRSMDSLNGCVPRALLGAKKPDHGVPRTHSVTP